MSAQTGHVGMEKWGQQPHRIPGRPDHMADEAGMMHESAGLFEQNSFQCRCRRRLRTSAQFPSRETHAATHHSPRNSPANKTKANFQECG